MEYSKAALVKRIQRLEQHLAELKARLAKLEENELHGAIDHLDEHLQVVDHEMDSLRAFWPEAMKEFRRLFGKQ